MLKCLRGLTLYAASTVRESWFVDWSDLFDHMDGIFIDDCHVNEKGNQIIAERVYCEIEPKLKEIN